jgi:hypothetical protein
MNLFWLDASALAKRYLTEKGTALMNHLFKQAAPSEMICLLQGVGERRGRENSSNGVSGNGFLGIDRNSTDALILRCALDKAVNLRHDGDDLILVSSDARLIRAAKAEGLPTFDPENDDQATLDALIN